MIRCPTPQEIRFITSYLCRDCTPFCTFPVARAFHDQPQKRTLAAHDQSQQYLLPATRHMYHTRARCMCMRHGIRFVHHSVVCCHPSPQISTVANVGPTLLPRNKRCSGRFVPACGSFPLQRPSKVPEEKNLESAYREPFSRDSLIQT